MLVDSVVVRVAQRPELLRLLGRRGLTLSEDERTRVLGCDDVATLDRWFDAALTAETVAEVITPSATSA